MSYTLTQRGFSKGTYSGGANVGDTFTPAADDIIVVFNVANDSTPHTTVTGWGATWVQLLAPSGALNYSVWACRIGASPGSSRAFIDFGGGSTNYCAGVIQITGCNNTAPIGVGGSNLFRQLAALTTYDPASPYSATALSAFSSATNLSLTLAGISANLPLTPKSGFTELLEASGITYNPNVYASYKAGSDTAHQVSETTAGDFDFKNVAIVAIEVLEAAGGTGAIYTDLKAKPSMTAALTTQVKLAAGLVSVAAMASSLSVSNGFFASFQSNPKLTAALTTSIPLGSNFATSERLTNALTNWSTVTLSGTLYNGNGSAVSPYLWTQGPIPPVGTTLYYDGTYVTIYSDAQTSSSQTEATAIVQWFDGVQWWISELVYTASEVTYLAHGSTMTNSLTTGITLGTSYQTRTILTPNLTTIVSLASNNASSSTLSSTLTTSITQQAALSSRALMVNNLSTGISLSASLSAKSTMTAMFGMPINAALASKSSMINALTTSIAAQTVLASQSGLSATFALPDTSIAAALTSKSTLTSALTTGVQLQTDEVSRAAVVNALTTQIVAATALKSSSSQVSTLGGAPAAFQTTFVSRSALVNDLYAYYPIFTSLVAKSSLNSSLGTITSLSATFECSAALVNGLTVIPVPLPPSWRCVTVGPLELETAGRALPDKDPEDVLDYAIVLDVQLSIDDPLKALSVSVEACVPEETPMTLVIDNALWAMSDPTSGLVNTIVFWLSGGTPGVTYVLRLEALDTETVPHTRVMVRRATITVAKQ